MDDAEAAGFAGITVQSTRTQGLLRELAAALDSLTQERPEPFWARAAAALGRISGVSVSGVGVNWRPDSADPGRSAIEAGAATGQSSSQLAATLAELATAIRAERGGGGLLIAVDEIQTTPAQDLETVGAALHQLNTRHPDAPVLFVAAGLPNTHDAMLGSDLNHPLITHPERLFTFDELTAHLDREAVALALLGPARTAGATWSEDAIETMYQLTSGYPAHLQVCAAATWAVAAGPLITTDDVEAALPTAAAEIERQFLAPRWNRTSDRQQEYLTALSLCGGTATARQLATVLERKGTDLSVTRVALLERGEIYSPRSRTIALLMPLMASYAPGAYPASRDASELHDVLLPLERLQANADSWRAAMVSDTPRLRDIGEATTAALRHRAGFGEPPPHQER